MQHKKNILVTGGAGFIGSCFVLQAVERGDLVVVIDLLTYAGHLANLALVKDKPNFIFIQGDIKDANLVASLLKTHNIDWLVNFAAESHVDNSIHSPSVFIETNILGTYNLLQSALDYYRNLDSTRQQSFRYIQISTDEVYGTLTESGKFSETSPMHPNSPYSASKAAGDHLARAWFETYALPVIVTNCSNNYGPRQFPEKLIPRMITYALEQKPLPIYGNGGNIRDWIHVEDHCLGLYLAMNQGVVGQTYCVGGNAEKTNIEVVSTICQILDKLRPLSGGKSYSTLMSFVADRPGHDYRYAIDDSKAALELGFKRQYDFTMGIEATVKWYLDNLDWCELVSN